MADASQELEGTKSRICKTTKNASAELPDQPVCHILCQPLLTREDR